MPDGVESTRRVGAPADTVPPRVPDHEILQKIGRGAYGEVWLARNIMGTFRAVKVIYRNRFEDAAPYEREFEGIRKFEPISRSHDGLVDILQIGRNDAAGYFYYVMELADDRKHGETIDPQVYVPRTLQTKDDRLPVDTCIDYALSLTDALRHLHDNRLIHRDIKPANIIFVRGIPKLADIGLVTDAGAEATLVGTPGFFSPEDAGTPQADIYSLGKVLYQITMGKDPRDFPDPPADLAQLPDQAKLLGMNAIILKACRTGVRGRYHSAQEMHQDLVALRDGGGSPRRLKGAVLAASACVLIALILLAYSQFTKKENTQQTPLPNIPSTVVSTTPPNTLSAEEVTAGFKLLFDGTTLTGWFAPSNNWQVQDGSIARVTSGADIEYRVEKVPDNFELRFEWRIERGSHSAVHYRPGNYQYHIVDNRDVRPPESHRFAGALWGVAGPQNAGMKPVGQWNEGRILCKGAVIEHWLNGEKVVSLDYTRPEWKPVVRVFQQRSHTRLAARGGYLRLQDRTGAIAFRSLRWKELE